MRAQAWTGTAGLTGVVSRFLPTCPTRADLPAEQSARDSSPTPAT